MENLVAILGTYTYDHLSKKIRTKVVKRIEIVENIEEKVTKKQVLVENTSADPMETATTNQALLVETEENRATMTRTIQS